VLKRIAAHCAYCQGLKQAGLLIGSGPLVPRNDDAFLLPVLGSNRRRLAQANREVPCDGNTAGRPVENGTSGDATSGSAELLAEFKPRYAVVTACLLQLIPRLGVMRR